MGTSPIVLNDQGQSQDTQTGNPLIPVLANPAFNQLPIAQQRQILAKRFPVANFDKLDDSGYYNFRKQTAYPLSESMDPLIEARKNESLKDKALDFARPAIDSLITGGTTAVAAPLGPEAAVPAGIAAGTLTDATIQNAYDNPDISGKDTSGKLAAGITFTGANELGGKVINKAISPIIRGVGAAVSTPGTNSMVDAMMQQYYNRKFGGSVAPWMRTLLPMIPLKGGQAAPDINGAADFIKSDLTSQLTKSQYASNSMAQTAKAIAAGNSVEIPSNINPEQYVRPGIIRQVPGPPVMKASNVLGANGQPVMQQVPGPPITLRKVDGPINLQETTNTLKSYLGEVQQTFGDPTKNITAAAPNDTPVVTAAKNLLALTENGTKPISFEDAWNFKQALASQYKKNKDVVPIYQAINKDIDSSMQTWPNDPNKVGLHAWQNAKATVDQRMGLFDEDGVKQVIDSTNAPNPDIDKVINDRQKLSRALTAGKLTLPDGTTLTSGVKENLRAYTLGQLFQDPKTVGAKLADPVMKDSYNQLFNKAEIDRVSNFAKHIDRSDVTNSSRLGFITPAGLALGAGLIVPHGGGVTPWEIGAGTLIGARLGWTSVNRLLANPMTNRIMTAVFSDQPLNMSQTAASKIITNVIKGATVYALDQDGNEHPQKLGEGQ